MADKSESSKKAGRYEIDIQIIRPNWKTIPVTIYGTSPLAMHAVPESTIINLERKAYKLPDIKFPSSEWRSFIDSLHWCDRSIKPDTLNPDTTEEEYEEKFNEILEKSKEEGKSPFYIPCEAFKESICSAAMRSGMSDNKVGMRCAFKIKNTKGQAPINFSEVRLEKSLARNHNAGKSLVVPVYAVFENWSATFTVQYNANKISAETMLNAIEEAGESIGVLARRVELVFGKYGSFTIQNPE